jgi:hypothetical protein
MYLKMRVAAGDRPETLPLASTDVVRVRRLRAGDELPAVDAILGDALDDLAFYDRYAVRWLFFRYLVTTHEAEVKDFLRRVRRLGGGSGLAKEAGELLRSRLGTKAFRALGEGWEPFVASLAPEWEEVFRDLSPEPAQRVQIAFPDRNAIAWRTAPVGKKEYSISGVLTILDNARHQMNLLLDRCDEGFVCVSISAHLGVTLFDYRSKEDRWNRLGFVARKELAVDRPMRVDLRVKGNRLTLLLDGESVLDEQIEGHTMQGPWGLGALAGSAGIWKDLRVR